MMRKLLLIALLLPWPALAQLGERSVGTAGPMQPNTAPQQVRPPPPALPGLAVRPAAAPIPTQSDRQLSPDAALFDSINRGDLAAARAAMARGADLDARNALGLTPIDAAVDQGRNEIAFFLLAARGQARVQGPPPEEARAPRRNPVQEAAERRAAERAALAARAAEANAVPLRPRLFAGDGGAARPEIGFLGFDAGRPAGARPRG
jgi:hypothetical protein